MKKWIKEIIIMGVIVKIIFMVMEGDIKLPTFISNNVDLKKMIDGDTIHIQGVGEFDYPTLFNTKKIVEDMYNVPVIIDEPITLSSDFYIDGFINTDKCLSDFDDNTNRILVTNNKCLSNHNGGEVGGQAELFGNIIFIGPSPVNELKSVIKHEIGHTQGLTHCDTPNCLMSETRSIGGNSLELCNKH